MNMQAGSKDLPVPVKTESIPAVIAMRRPCDKQRMWNHAGALCDVELRLTLQG
jgi:hypothetical protein